jgi:hypothetical protein
MRRKARTEEKKRFALRFFFSLVILDIDVSIDRYNNNNSSSCLLILYLVVIVALYVMIVLSEIHFGVSTYEACKTFFRRTSLSSYSISQLCSTIWYEINIKNRNNCPSCRFDKFKRHGIDRENVIYEKPSKQQVHSSYHQDCFLEQLTNISNKLIKNFQTSPSLSNSIVK